MFKYLMPALLALSMGATAQESLHVVNTTHYSEDAVVAESEATSAEQELRATVQLTETDRYLRETHGQVEKVYHNCGDIKLLDSMLVYDDQGSVTRITAYEYDADCRRTRQMQWHTYAGKLMPLTDKQIDHISPGEQDIDDYYYKDGSWHQHSTTKAYLDYDNDNNLRRYEHLVYKGDSLHTHKLEEMDYSGPGQLQSRKVTDLKIQIATDLTRYQAANDNATVIKHYKHPDTDNRLIKRDTIYHNEAGQCLKEVYYSARCGNKLHLVKQRDHNYKNVTAPVYTPQVSKLDAEIRILPSLDHLADITVSKLDPATDYTLQVFDISGRLLRAESISGSSSYRLTVHAQGIIIARITDASGAYAQEKSLLP
jgi:hypothetical protein